MYTSVVFIHFSEEHTEVPLFFVLGQLHPRGLGVELKIISVAFFVFATYFKEKKSAMTWGRC